ncbi:MAG: hypothetical protein Q9175_001944 [Cornicularia normoerica]
MMHVLLLFFALAALILAVEDEEKKEDKAAYALIPAYLGAAILSFIFIAWALWRIVHDWGRWKIHASSPRPQYLRTLFGWVDRETLELKQAKRAKRREAKRDQHKFYRTTKANYKWIFHDPTGELQQRFDDQKQRCYLRLIPSWMRSYPHGTLQSGTMVKQGNAPKGIYQWPELQLSSYSRLTISETLQHAQLDGYPMSGALRDPYRLPDLLIIELLDAIMAAAPEKLWLPSKVSAMDQPDVIQIWRIREIPLPERLGLPPRESEQQLSGEVEPQETLIRRDTEHRLREGGPQERMNEFVTVPRDGLGRPFRHPRVFSTQPVRDTPDPEAIRSQERRQRYIEDLGRRIQEVRTDLTVMLVRGTLDNLMQDFRQARGSRHWQAPVVSRPPVRAPLVPENVRQANRLQHYIEDIQSRIHDLRAEPILSPVRGRLDSLMHELRRARGARERLGPVASLRPAAPTAQPQVQNPIDQLPVPIENTAVGFEPRPRMTPDMWRSGMAVQGPDRVEVMNVVDSLHHLVMENVQNHLSAYRNRSGNRDFQAINRDGHVSNSLSQGLNIIRANVATDSLGPAHRITQRLLRNIQNINASVPIIVTPRTHGEANRAVIENLATDDNANSNSTSEEEVQPNTQHPIAAAILRSVPDHDPTLDQADPAAQRHLEPEETIGAEDTRQTAPFHTEIGRSDPDPDAHVQGEPTENDSTPINTLDSPSSSAATISTSTATATLATVIATPSLQELDDAVNEELYSDAYP